MQSVFVTHHLKLGKLVCWLTKPAVCLCFQTLQCERISEAGDRQHCRMLHFCIITQNLRVSNLKAKKKKKEREEKERRERMREGERERERREGRETKRKKKHSKQVEELFFKIHHLIYPSERKNKQNITGHRSAHL